MCIRDSPYMKKIITAMGITIIEKEGFEADDIIGTVSAACADTVSYTHLDVYKRQTLHRP